MSMKQRWKTSSATIAMFAMVQNSVALAAPLPSITAATSTGTVGAANATKIGQMTALTDAAKIRLLRRKIKYVFVLFQENRSFDHYFGTYPGANGLFSSFPGADLSDPMQQPANATVSFSQTIQNTDGSFGTQTPFLMPRTIQNVNSQTVPIYPEDSLSVDHSHTGMEYSAHFDAATRSHSKNDGYVLDEEGYRYSGDASTVSTIVQKSGAPVTAPVSLATKQAGELMVAHVDCDTVPFLWQYADRFALLDNFHQTTFGPSTPNAIAMIAGQTGETQWAKHPATTGNNIPGGQSVPNVTDTAPFAGSAADTSPGPKPPYGPDEATFASSCSAGQACATPLPPATGPLTTVTLKGEQTGYYPGQIPLTFASLPLSFMGNQVNGIVSQDENPTADLLDIQHDISAISSYKTSTNWGWYQQGYGAEPFDGKVTVDLFPSDTPHSSYIVHHNGPQYFGYLGDNPAEQAKLHSLQQFYTDVANSALPESGGVFYVRGGYFNNDNMVSLDSNPNVRATYAGNDDHPSYSDAQISEASVADSVNAIAASKYWNQSAIIVTYDETDGMYDHVPEMVRSWGPDHYPLAGGPRIPAIVISPYAASHIVSHVYSEHGSVIKLIDNLFSLKPLAELPDEVEGRNLGSLNQTNDPSLFAPDGKRQYHLGPSDGKNSPLGSLLEAFDNDRLLGGVPKLPPSYATIASPTSLPQYNGAGCKALGITPTDYTSGYTVGTEIDPPPADFNPRPSVTPGIPSSASWTP